MSIVPFGFWESRNVIQTGLVLNVDATKRNSYPGTGTTWTDLSTSGFNGALTNGPTFDSANSGNLVFDGVDDYVQFGDVLDLGTNDMTINTWLKLNSTWTTANRGVVSKISQANINYRYGTRITPNRYFSAFFGLVGTDVKPNGSTVLNVGQWYMCTAVYKRNASISLYVNGVVETLTGSAVISQWDGVNFQSTLPFRIAANTSSDNTTPILFLPGNISMVQVYFRALSATEIAENFNSTKGIYGL